MHLISNLVLSSTPSTSIAISPSGRASNSMACKTMPPTFQQPIDLQAGNIDNVVSLQKGLARLPQELYDQVYDLTFTADAAVRMFFDEAVYKDRGALNMLSSGSTFGPAGQLHKHLSGVQRSWVRTFASRIGF